MKITKEVLQKIIAEEKSAMLAESEVEEGRFGRDSYGNRIGGGYDEGPSSGPTRAKNKAAKSLKAAKAAYATIKNPQAKASVKQAYDALYHQYSFLEYGDPEQMQRAAQEIPQLVEDLDNAVAYSRESTDPGLAEGKLTREYLQSIIKEEYSMLMKEYEAWMVGDDGVLRDDEGNEVYVGGPAREWRGPWPKDKYGREKHGSGSSSYGGRFPSETPENVAKLEAALAKQPNNEFLKSVVSQVKSGKSLSPKQKSVPMIARILGGGGSAAPSAPAAAAPTAAPSAGASPLAAKAQALVAQKPELANSSTIKDIMAGKTPNKFALAAFERKYGVKLS